MRDVLLSATAGFLASCAGGFAVHRALWKSADEQCKELEKLLGVYEESPPKSSTRKLADSFEGFIAKRIGQYWNSRVDNVHRRLVDLPTTMNRIAEDVKPTKNDGSTNTE